MGVCYWFGGAYKGPKWCANGGGVQTGGGMLERGW